MNTTNTTDHLVSAENLSRSFGRRTVLDGFLQGADRNDYKLEGTAS
ncbi:MAG TPA: hypothetical protein H9870_13870 [Candidatus Corynebacterium avicola]|uniref:Uncharacterized protein n=1 Tax=Candidatus Corynebacterium avicola TaxID=2838527 RepID=A0A9D1RQM2_9CORY|nr:hypothetical protein [Candidatus Corynebacterium avicola]